MYQPKIDESPQGSEEWHQRRTGKFTASRAADLMLRNKNGSPTAKRKAYIEGVALERLTGEIPEFFETDAMREGRERERTAALAYSFHTGHETQQTGFWYTEYYGASPDDLVVGMKKGVEYKNPKATTHYETLRLQQIPPYYYWQCIQNLLVTGFDEWDYVSFHPKFPPSAQLYIETIERKYVENDITLLEKELAQAESEVKQLIQFIENYKEDA